MKKNVKMGLIFVLMSCLILAFMPVNSFAEATGKIAEPQGYDTTAPVVNSVSVETPNVVKPGYARIKLNITEEETGVSQLYVHFSNVTSKYYFYAFTDYQDPLYSGTYYVNLKVPSNISAEKYYPQDIKIVDKAGNTNEYCHNTYNNGTTVLDSLSMYNTNDTNWPRTTAFTLDSAINVQNEFDVNFESYITNASVVSKLNSMSAGETAMIDFDGYNYTATKAMFDAIKGQDKRIVFSNDGIQWIINGKDIVNETKDVNLNVEISNIPGSSFGNSNQISQVKFYSNGLLPGPMQIRMKDDYIYDRCEAKGTFYLYYLNGNTVDQQNGDQNKLVFDGTDKWCYFTVSHNSTYLLSDAALHNKTVVIKPHKVFFKTIKSKKKGALTISWRKITGISGYQIQIATNKAFTKHKKTVLVKSKSATLKTVVKLKKKTKYYVRIRGYKITTKYVYGGWSNLGKGKTK